MRVARLMFVMMLMSACGDGLISVGSTELTLTTDRTEYTAHHVSGDGHDANYQFTVRLQVENIGTGTVFMGRCHPGDPTPSYGVGLSNPVGGRESAFNPVWGCGGHNDNIRLEPGQRRSFDLLISGPNIWDGYTGEPLGILEGEMRIALGVVGTTRDIDGGEPPGISNVFRVRKAPTPRR